VSEELRAGLRGLSGQQAAGVLRIVQAELDGRSITSLLDGPDRICNHSTYYRRGGWRDKAAFVQALELARRDYRSWLLEHGAREALTILADGAPSAARALRQQGTGDESAVAVLVDALDSVDAGLRSLAAESLGRTGSPAAVPALRQALAREEEPGARRAMLQAIGDIAAWRDADQRDAAGEILDRVDVKTAPKSASTVQGGFGLGALSDVELEQLLANLEAAAGGGAVGAGTAGEGARPCAPTDGPAGVDGVTPEDAGPGTPV